MVGVRSDGDNFTIEHLSVVRLVRVEPGFEEGSAYSAISTTDVVHIDALAEYVSDVIAAARLVVAQVNENAVCLLTGEGVHPSTVGELSGIEEGEAPGKAGEERYPLAAMTDDAFVEAWYERFRAVHSQRGATTADDGPDLPQP